MIFIAKCFSGHRFSTSQHALLIWGSQQLNFVEAFAPFPCELHALTWMRSAVDLCLPLWAYFPWDDRDRKDPHTPWIPIPRSGWSVFSSMPAVMGGGGSDPFPRKTHWPPGMDAETCLLIFMAAFLFGSAGNTEVPSGDCGSRWDV